MNMNSKNKVWIGIGTLVAAVAITAFTYPLFARSTTIVRNPSPLLQAREKRKVALMGACYDAFRRGDVETGKNCLQQVTGEFPSDGFLAVDAADLLFRHGLYREALPHYRRNWKSLVGTSYSVAARELACASVVNDPAAMQEALEHLGTTDKVEGYLRGASTLERAGDGQAMLDLVLRAEKLEPHSPKVAKMLKRAAMTIEEQRVRRQKSAPPTP